MLDFVAEEGAENEGFAMTRAGGSYSVIGNIVGTCNELAELMVLAQSGKVTLHTQTYPLAEAEQALADLDAGRVRGRAILVP